jgi:hypothetical protein
MKKLIICTIFLTALMGFHSGKADNDQCKVLVPELEGEYTGDCRRGIAHGSGKAVGVDTYEGEFKRGYPHGDGKYIWANGDIYEGEFRNGKPDGEGILTKQNGETQKGYWKLGYFSGEDKNPPLYKINRKQYINNYSIQRVGEGNKVGFVWQWGSRTLYTADGLQMIGSSGTESIRSNFTGFEDIIFPFNSHLEFSATDKAGTFTYQCIFDFDLLIPGEYIVRFSF